jgi:excisionase family DNA binding protein
MTTTLNPSEWKVSEPWLAMGFGLAEKLALLGQPAKANLLVRALHELLDGQDAASKELRMAMQIHLAIASNSNGSRSNKKINVKNEDLLSTQEAAQLMDCSRPFVAMLIDAKKLHGAVKSKGGHRKVPKSSVLQWIEDSKLKKEDSASDKNYRKAARDAGMYAVPDEAYVKAARKSRRSAG